MNLYAHAESNTRKTWIYLSGFFLFVMGIGWAASYYLQSSGILYFAVVLSLFMSAGSFWYSDKLVLKMSKAQPVQKKDNPELYRAVENLAITAGLPTPRIFVIQDKQPNAFATGRDAKHAVVAVTTGLLEKLEPSELQGVLAHELSHIGNKDILLSTVVVVLAGVVAIIADFFFRAAFWGGRRDDRRGGQTQGVIVLVALIFLIAVPVVSRLIQFAISRKREFLADASGALLSRYPEGLARALEKIAADPNQLKSANDATAHLYFASPFKGREQASWIHRLFMTHPPIDDRIKALREMNL
ncbi:MAG: M48 family metallopeptidase [Candidatus Wildermuthbacteria bacterium]|nr:M48 family metallopeptidase [Candidatus Wildermuthbacteria bacterium]